MNTYIPICQSCGMPMEKPSDFGTNHNGKPNEDYCNYCYKLGDFTSDRMSLERMVEKLIPRVVNMGMPEDKARKMAYDKLSNLKRWEKD